MSTRGMTGRSDRFETVILPQMHDVLAPDSSEIRVLGRVSGGSMAHGTLPPGRISLAVVHRTVEEIWFVLDGAAEVWRKLGEWEETIEARAGRSITLPVGTQFQFRTLGTTSFQFLMCTIPGWPGDGEAVRVPDHWPV